VRAAPVRHTAPTVGYCVEEAAKPGRLNPALVLPLLEKNREALIAEWGVRDPRQLMKQVKALQPGESLELPDGQVIRPESVIGATRRGRKVVVLGDCSDASLCAPLATGADLLVHEATNSYLPQFGDRGGAAALERTTIARGHSTPQMAGRTAAAFGAHNLLLTHFSQRYVPTRRDVMTAIRHAAAREADLPVARVFAAHDGMALPIWQPDRNKPLVPHNVAAAGSQAKLAAVIDPGLD